jgi:hypothetical protein
MTRTEKLGALALFVLVVFVASGAIVEVVR